MSIKESALTAITAISNSDFVRAVTSAGASRRITVANLAKQIIEGYSGSSLAGSNQSVKSALDALKPQSIVSDTDLNTMTTIGDYYCVSSSIASSLLNCPTTNNFVMRVVLKGPFVTQILTDATKLYIRTQTSSGFSIWYRYDGTAMS